MTGDYTVIIPAYNAGRTISEAIQSIKAQSCRPARLIVVDDGSTDETAAIAAAMGAEVIRQRNAGPGAACNNALEKVETPFVAFLDADDLWLPEKAAMQLALFAADPGLDGSFGHQRRFHHGMPVDPASPPREGWGRTTMMMRTPSMRRVGPIFDPPNGGRGDMIDWIARARDLGMRLVMTPEVTTLRRIIPGSMTYHRNGSDSGYLEVARRALLRKRGEAVKADP